MMQVVTEIAANGHAPFRYRDHQDAAVSCRHVTKEFGTGDNRALVLRGVDFDVQFGEMTLLVGPIGCGKTTLLSLIAGLLDPTSGGISVLGPDVNHLSCPDIILFPPMKLPSLFPPYHLAPAPPPPST